MDKIICEGRIVKYYETLNGLSGSIELKTPTAEEVARLEDGQEVLIYRKIPNAAYYKKGGFNDYNDDKIAYILPKTEQKDELDELKFNEETNPSCRSIGETINKLIDIIKEMKSK